MKKTGFLMIPLFAAVLLITACGAGSKSYMASETAAAPMETSAGAEAYDKSFDTDAQKGDSGAGAAMNTEEAVTPPLPEGRKLIRTVNMQVETEQFDKMISNINAKLTELGGYVEKSDVSGNSLNYRGEPVPRYGSITARIPSDKLDGFVGAVSASGNVTDKSESAQDVTLQYSDVESRKKSLEIEQERIWKLLEKAESIDTVISLEQRLSDIRYQLESMESQLRLYDNQVDYSTVYLSISEVTAYTPIAPESTGTRIRNGLICNFESLLTAITDLLILLITSCPFWLPLAIIAAVVISAVRRHNRKSGRISSKEKLKNGRKQGDSGKAENRLENGTVNRTENGTVNRTANRTENGTVNRTENRAENTSEHSSDGNSGK